MTRSLGSLLVALSLGCAVLVSLTCVGSDTRECPNGVVCPEGTQCAAVQLVCIEDNCGNGVIEPDRGDGVEEICDDGNIEDGDGCAANCASDETCGNGVVDRNALVPETCDPGPNPTDEMNRMCANDCRSNNVCGNGVTNTEIGEVCDDNNTDNGDGCSADCLSKEICGNGIEDVGEDCDDGNTEDGDNCSSTCGDEGCGNGSTDPDEACDDGNTTSGDGCSSDCLSTEICGNDYVDQARGEVCDEGDTEDGDGCSADCRSDETCGNDVIDLNAAIPEVCDDDNTSDGDGCSANCRSNETCGNGERDVNAAIPEACDDGNTVNGPCLGASPPASCFESCGSDDDCDAGFFCDELGSGLCNDLDTCSSDCQSGQGCPNGAEDVGEECDDGDSDNTNDCTNACNINVCGDGIVDIQGPRFDQCDDGGESDDCTVLCTDSRCGDGIVNPSDDRDGTTEQCDNAEVDGLDVDSAICDDDCTAPVCGDGHHNAFAVVATTGELEACDGNDAGIGGMTASCDVDCSASDCGDGVVNTLDGEQCDGDGDGDGDPTDECDVDCTAAFCGDGRRNALAGEACDGTGALDGSTQGTPGQTATCDVDCTAAQCGDGVLNEDAGEFCDPADGQDAACDMPASNDPEAEERCTIASCGDGYTNAAAGEDCDDEGDSADCDADCTQQSCGDGYLNTATGTGADEECDDGNSILGDGCGLNCKLERCGNSVVDPGEACDDGDTDATPLSDTCSADCTVAHSCGNGVVTANEVCDDGDNLTNTECTYGVTTSPCIMCNAGCGGFTASLPRQFCGNGTDDGTEEVCDDGNTITETQCAYPDADGCTLCDRTCQTSLSFPANACGDGNVDAGNGEQCDDGNNTTESCAYGVASCQVCNSTCQNQTVNAPSGNVCGDNVDHDPCAPPAGDDPASCSLDCTDDADCPNGFFCEEGPNKCRDAECDDGNTITETECPYGSAGCTICDSACNDVVLPSNRCGDGFFNPDEEACDDGNTSSETQCPYGQAECTACSSDCNTVLNLTGNVCGDGNDFVQCDGVGDPSGCAVACPNGDVDCPNGFFCKEDGTPVCDANECDDGNTTTETACDYGDASCPNEFCSSDCSDTLVLAGNVCGDGVVDPDFEVCDDDNLACGSCSATCDAVESAKATGFIVAPGGSSFVDTNTDRDNFVLDDGFGNTVTFEFHFTDGGHQGGSHSGGFYTIDITATSTPAQVRTAIATAINLAHTNGDILITAVAATAPANWVALTHDRFSALGSGTSQAITENVTNDSFAAIGMTGGLGGDCDSGASDDEECTSDLDCASDNCVGTPPNATCEP